MNVKQVISDWQEETDIIIESLLADGSDPKAQYTFEHHLAGPDFNLLEKAAVDCFKAGFEVSDAEEAELEDGSDILCFDVIALGELNADRIKADIETLANIAAKHKVAYDGWGTYFEGDQIDDEDDDDDFIDDADED
jgi:regulator of RNase E activity RraB